MTDVAVIIPAYNAEDHIADALTCVLAQDHVAQVVVVDDGSSDSTLEVVARFGPQVTALRQANAGPAVARNRGVAATTAPLIAFLDADDLWVATRLRHAVAAFEADASLALQVCLAQNQTFDGTPVGEPTPAYVAGGVVLRRSAWEAIGPFDASLPHGAGLDWFMRARDIDTRIQLVGQVMLLRRLREASFSALNAADSHREHLSVLRASLARRRGLTDEPTKT